MALTRPSVLPVWADTGDKTQPTDPELLVGWPVTSIPPSRQRFNWFFNWVSNGIRYLTRRGIPDWVNTETHEIGDRCQSLIDGKTYRSIVAANINFEPSTNPLKWERWGFTLSELWAYIASGLYGGACPNTGPASAPTLANPYLEYTSALGEIWRYVGGQWKVIANRYGVRTTYANNATNGVSTIYGTVTLHRAGRIFASATGQASSNGLASSVYASGINLNGVSFGSSSTYNPNAGNILSQAASGSIACAAGDVLTFVYLKDGTGNAMNLQSTYAYID